MKFCWVGLKLLFQKMGLIKNQNLDWRPSCDVITSPEVNVPSFLKVKCFLAVQKMSIPGFEPGNSGSRPRFHLSKVPVAKQMTGLKLGLAKLYRRATKLTNQELTVS